MSKYPKGLFGTIADLTIASKAEQRRAARNEGYKGFGAGILIGLVVGAAAGILFAPQSGAETRGQIADTSVKAYNAVKEKGAEIIEAAQEKGVQVVEAAKEKGAEVISEVKEHGTKLVERVRGLTEEVQDEENIVCEAADEVAEAAEDAAEAVEETVEEVVETVEEA